ncbi:DUF1801 domain-containing protein [Wenyingzhuangia sp. IMCC45533]
MINSLDYFYLDQQEPVKSCLLALKQIILNYDSDIESKWYYRLPCFMYQNQIFCYLWVDKKTGFPYIAIGKGVKIDHPALLIEKRTFTKRMLIDPKRDIPIKNIHEIFDKVKALY